MSPRYTIASSLVAGIMAGTVALGTLAAPANAASIGPRDANHHCALTLTTKEKNFAIKLFDDSKRIGAYETGRDRVAAIEEVFPAAKTIGPELFKGRDPRVPTGPTMEITVAEQHRAALQALGMPDPVISQYVDGYYMLATETPVTRVRLDDVDVENRWVSGDPLLPGDAPEATAPVGNPDGVDAELAGKLHAAWIATPSGDVADRHERSVAAERQAQYACKNGTPTEIAFPETDETPRPGSSVPEGSSQPGSSRFGGFDQIMGLILNAALAILGLLKVLPKFGITLPFHHTAL